MDRSTNVHLNDTLLQVQDQPSSSRTKMKLRSIFSLVTLFTLIVIAAIISLLALLKHKAESKSLSNNPYVAIQSVCWLPNLSEHSRSCARSMFISYYADDPPPFWLNRNKINPSQILMLSIYASMNELSDPEKLVTYSEKPANSKTDSVLKECEWMFKFSLTQLNESIVRLSDYPNEKILETKKLVWDLHTFIGEAQGQVERCIEWLDLTESNVAVEMRKRTRKCQQYMRNSRGILENVDEILDMFYPRIGPVFGSLILDFFQYDLTVWFFCLQYLFIVLLFWLFVRTK